MKLNHEISQRQACKLEEKIVEKYENQIFVVRESGRPTIVCPTKIIRKMVYTQYDLMNSSS